MSSSPRADVAPSGAAERPSRVTSGIEAGGVAGSVPRIVPLTGSDCFLRAFDDEVRRYNGASHVSQLILRLGPGFDVGVLERLLREVAAAVPLVRAPIRRRYGVGLPVYRIDLADRMPPPVVTVHAPEPDGRPTGPVPSVFAARMNDRFLGRRGRLLHFDVVPYADGTRGTDLAMSWLHMLFDGTGSETFIAQLDQCFQGTRRVADLMTYDRPPAPREQMSARGQRARAWREHITQLGAQPPRSLAGPLRSVPQSLRLRIETLSVEETTRAVERAKALAGFLTPMLFYLAATIRAHDRVFRARGLDPGSYVVPLPVNLRPKGVDGAVFRSHVSLLWFQVRQEQVSDLEELIAELKRQRHASIKGGLVEGGVAAMDFVRFLPKRLYARMTRRGMAGELCSFFFAYTDQFVPAADSFLGAQILNGFHAPAVTPSPGSCLAMSLRGGRLNVTHVYQSDVLVEDEIEEIRRSVRADLIGEAR